MNHYRRKLPPMPEAKNILLTRETAGPPQGNAVAVRIRGDDWVVLRRIANRIEEYLNGIDGVVDVRSNFQEGKTELRVKIDRSRASQLGLSPEDNRRIDANGV